MAEGAQWPIWVKLADLMRVQAQATPEEEEVSLWADKFQEDLLRQGLVWPSSESTQAVSLVPKDIKTRQATRDAWSKVQLEGILASIQEQILVLEDETSSSTSGLATETIFVLFAFRKKIIDLPGGQFNDPSSRGNLFCLSKQQLYRLILRPLKGF